VTATIIDGRAVAARVRADVAADVVSFAEQTRRRPGLATILVGDDPASAIYVANKRKACAEAGIADLHRHLPADAAREEVSGLIEACNRNPEVSGILLQLPLPEGLDAASLTALIAPGKDVDGLTPISAGRLVQGTPGLRPCTPLGVIDKPLAALLLARNATVTVCHSRTRDLASVCSRADVLVAAVGVPSLLGAEHVKLGAAVIDVGMNRTEEGLRGDVDYESAAERAGLITPVPGGVGPMTIAMLLRNTLTAARLALAE